MTKNKIRLGDLFSDLGLLDDNEKHRALELSRIATVEEAREGDLVFIAQEAYLPALQTAKPTVFVISDALWAKLPAALPGSALRLRSKDAMLAFAKASRHFKTEATAAPGIHASAFVHPSAKIGKDVSIGAFAVVEEGAEIGSASVIHPRVHIGARAKLGSSCVLFPGVVLYQDTILGERVRIHANTVIGADGFGYAQEKRAGGVDHVKIHHLGSVRIGDDTEIGASTTIDRGTVGETVIGRGCIIDNQVQIGHNCVIEEGVIICGCVGLAGSAHVGKYALLAGFVAVANKVKIGAGAQVAGYTAVTGHVPPGASWGGRPGRPLREYMRLQALISRLPEWHEERKKALREKNT
jgi:UDP-3-O-[3-hydroxymyristoyl] glucosamine N-acyltransferase